MRPEVLSGKPPKPSRLHPAAIDLVGQRGQRAGTEPSGSDEGRLGAQGASYGEHEAKGGAGFATIQRASMKGFEETELNASGGGPNREAVFGGFDLCAQRSKTANRRLDIGAGRIADHVSGVVCKRRGDDQAVSHRLRCDCGHSAGEWTRIDDRFHVPALCLQSLFDERAELIEGKRFDAYRSDSLYGHDIHRVAMAFLIGLGMPEERVDIEIG